MLAELTQKEAAVTQFIAILRSKVWSPGHRHRTCGYLGISRRQREDKDKELRDDSRREFVSEPPIGWAC